MSNYGVKELQEIEDAGLPLPAVNQIMSNPLVDTSATYDWCQRRGVKVQARASFSQMWPLLDRH